MSLLPVLQRLGKSHRIPLRHLLVFPFVLQIFGAVGLTGYLSLRNGQQAVNQLVDRLREEVSQRIDQHLDSYTARSRYLAQITGEQIDLGLINPQNLDQMQRLFWRQVRLYGVGYVLYGSRSGEFAAAGHYFEDGTVSLNEVARQRWGNDSLYVYRTDDQANSKKLATVVPHYGQGFQQEGWYTSAIEQKKPTWSPIYQWETAPYHLSIAASYPIHDRQSQVIGAIAVEQRLSQISDFLRSLTTSPHGRTFILERNAFLVANSGDQHSFVVENNKPRRLKGFESADPTIRRVSQHLIGMPGGLAAIQTPQQLAWTIAGQRQFVQVTPWRDPWGLDWLVVVVVPESDFVAQIQANTQTTIWLCLAALGLATGLGIYTARWITRPILQLESAAAAIAVGEWDQPVPQPRLKELSVLADSFQRMVQQLRGSFQQLNQTNAELSEAMTQLQQSQVQLVQQEKMSALGQLMAGIAHEINNPLGCVKGNLACMAGYVQDLRLHLALYQQGAAATEIADHAEEIELEYLLEDVSKVLTSSKDSIDRIRDISVALRTFSRTDTAQKRTFDVHDGLDSTLLILKHRLKANAQRSAIKVIKEYGCLDPIQCFPGQLNQVFMNLLANAIDALEEMPIGEATAPSDDLRTIDIRTEQDDRATTITIQDNGAGIPLALQERIFEASFTTKPVGKGTGLGLAISRQIIVEKHLGELMVRSTPGEGTAFTIRLPQESTIEADSEESSPQASAQSAGAGAATTSTAATQPVTAIQSATTGSRTEL